MIDHYELLQISPQANAETIHRVYRFLASRYHPDNPDSGDAELFRNLKTAYDVLSNPTRRAEYDATLQCEAPPLSSTIDFMDNLEGELNRRIAVLAVLYFRRRTNPHAPEVSLTEIEKRMGFPRDYLDFTTWYLVKKGFITRADNSDFTLTADGVDFVETQRTSIPVLNRLLTDGRVQLTEDHAATNGHANSRVTPIVLPTATEGWGDRRMNKKDRRVNPYGRRAGDIRQTA
jgi:curved DNA-binding protein CbpA